MFVQQTYYTKHVLRNLDSVSKKRVKFRHEESDSERNKKRVKFRHEVSDSERNKETR